RPAGSVPRAMSRAGVPGWLLICGHLVIQLAFPAMPVQYAFRGGTVAAAGGQLGTLLGPEGTGLRGAVFSDRDGPPRVRRVLSRGRPYLENCTVDASIYK